MRTDRLHLLVEPGEIHEFVRSLWSDGPVARSHAEGGLVHRLVERFARVPRIFFESSDQQLEWTHFSAWWGAILLCDYDNPAIRDLRYLHEICHAATTPHVAGLNLATFEARSLRNEREASTLTELAIYLELPELRALTFEHPIFADRFLFPSGDRSRPDARLAARWRDERDLVFQELMYHRQRVVSADASEIDPEDPQVAWLRRYVDQGAAWVQVWTDRHDQVDRAMIALREASAAGDRRAAAERHLAWLLSPAIAGDSDIPFRDEAARFRATFDTLLQAYDAAMDRANLIAVRARG